MSKQGFLPLLLVMILLAGCATGRLVGYQNEIHPILKNRCHQCHLPPDGEGFLMTGLSMETYDSLMRGTVFGEVIIPGDSRRSILNKLVEGRAGSSMRMPLGSTHGLSDEEIELLKLWVEQGAKNN